MMGSQDCGAIVEMMTSGAERVTVGP